MQKVSIILPVYNVERYLASSLDSVLNQTHENWELLISDNCSQDSTCEIATSYANKDKRIIYAKNDRNLGVMENYNRCIERASGDYIELFGGDDLFEPQCLEKLVDVLDNNANVVLVTCARNLIDENGQCTKVERPFTETRVLASEEAIRSNMGPLNNWIMSPVMYRSKLKASGFDTTLRIWSDLDYWVRILQAGDLYYLDDVLFSYRVHPGSETSRAFRDLEFAVDMLRLADRHSKYIVNPHDPKHSLENILGAKLLALCHHAINHRDASFDSLLAPLTDSTVREIGSKIAGENRSENLEALIRDSHDHRRAACLALLCGANLHGLVGAEKGKLAEYKMQVDALEENRDKVSVKRDAAIEERDRLGKRVEELKNGLAALQSQQKKLASERDEALKQLDIASSQIVELNQDLSGVHNSLSWKITALLRKAKQKAIPGRH